MRVPAGASKRNQLALDALDAGYIGASDEESDRNVDPDWTLADRQASDSAVDSFRACGQLAWHSFAGSNAGGQGGGGRLGGGGGDGDGGGIIGGNGGDGGWFLHATLTSS